MKKYYFLTYTLLLGCFYMTSCGDKVKKPKDTTTLLTAHKWQLVAESGLDLPKESLRNNIIELKNDGGLVYYENLEDSQDIFLENKWSLSDDEKRIIEILPDESRIETEIVEVTDSKLKIRYIDPLGDQKTVEEIYHKFQN